MQKNELSDSDVIGKSKIAHNWSGLAVRSNHAGSLIGSAQLAGADGVFLSGITMVVEVKAPIISNECLFLFSIMRLTGKQRMRVYQLEVCPSAKRSHNGDPVLYGPHEHLVNQEPSAIVETSVTCNNWDGCLVWFMRRINLKHFEIARPC